MFNYDSIKKEINESYDKMMEFLNTSQSGESSRFKYQLSVVIIIPILTILGILAFRFKKANGILVISWLVYLFMIVNFIITGLNTSFFLLSIDLCEEVYKYSTSSLYPFSGKGIGTYVSCPSKVILF